MLLGTITLSNCIGLPDRIISAISFDPFSNKMALITIVFAMMISSLLIFLFNYWITFKKVITDKGQRVKVAISIALVTIPWTFLLPTKWFYHGL